MNTKKKGQMNAKKEGQMNAKKGEADEYYKSIYYSN